MKSLLLTLLFIVPIAFNSQHNKDFEAENYLKKSISKRKTGKILLITGGGLFLTGLAVGATGNQSGGYFLSTNQLVGGGMMTLGVLSALTSVPFFISSGHNERKYLKISPTATILPKKFITGNENFAVAGLEISF